MSVNIIYPPFAKDRGPGYWLRFGNIWKSRRKFFRKDRSNDWRYLWGTPARQDRSTPIEDLLEHPAQDGFKFIIIGDTGEGDKSQYCLLPLIKALAPDFMIINGDVTYPAGNTDDYLQGFFKPYRGLNIPIWAVPGNHEYYSKNKGREFYETFCTNKWKKRWSDNSLRFVQQPGTYWELNDPTGATPLVILGIDSGQNAELDGKGKHKPDSRQHEWLKGRLEIAQRKDKKVILLFHIPGLANQKHNEDKLATLHQIIARYSCIKLVLGAHYHNHQQYNADIFKRYLREQEYGDPDPAPELVVSGNGGASLSSTIFKAKKYPAAVRYPSEDQWRGYAKIGKRLVDGMGFSKTLIGFIVSRFEEAVRFDFDPEGLLSFLYVEVSGGKIEVSHYFMDNIQLLFDSTLGNSTVNLEDAHRLISSTALQRMRKDLLTM